MAEGTGLLDAPSAPSTSEEETKRRRAWRGRTRLPEAQSPGQEQAGGPADDAPSQTADESRANAPEASDESDRARQLGQERRQDQIQAQAASPAPANAGAKAEDDTPTRNLNALQRLRRARQALRGPRAAAEQVAEAAREITRQAVLQALRGAWRAAHRIVENVALDFFYIPVLTALPALLLFVIRIFLGQILGQFFSISVRGVRVPLVPSMTMAEIVERSFFNLLILVITAIWIFLIWLLIYGMQNIPKVTLDILIDKLGNLLGGG